MLQKFTTNILHSSLCILFIASVCFRTSDSAGPALVVPADSYCACPGRPLVYTCTAVGGGSTLWRGSAFNSCPNNFINLRHSLFNSSERVAAGDCNNGAIVGMSLRVEDNCYTSQLSVRVSVDFNNKTIQCDHRSGTETTTIRVSTMTVITDPLLPPVDVHPVTLFQGNLTFEWSSVAPACSSNLEYQITSMSCGNCALSSDSGSRISATCFNLPLPMTSCSFSVGSVVCGNQIGDPSSPVEMMLKVPGVPQVNILPVYSDGKILSKIMVTNNQTIFPYPGFSVPVTNYGISFSNSTTGVMFNSTNTAPCVDEVCEYLPDLSTYCHPVGSISITVSATNEFGIGSPTDPVSIECINNFVEVVYDKITSTIICAFNDPLNITGKSCTVEYGNCNQQMGRKLEGSSTQESPNIVTLKLQSIDSNQRYCYNATASNGSDTIIVMGSIGMNDASADDVPVVIAVIIVILAVAIMVVVAATVVIVFLCRRQQARHDQLVELSDDHNDVGQTPLNQHRDRIKDELKLRRIEDGCFKSLNVDDDCQLREFLESRKLNFWRGCAYYEFTHEIEHVSEVKQLIFMKNSGKLFSPTVNTKTLKNHGFLGERVSLPKLDGYRLFVQSTGSGARHLPADSMILYDLHEEDSHESMEPPLRPLFSDYFKMTKVDSDCTLREFCLKHRIHTNKFNVFLEFGAVGESGDIRDVILAKKPQTTPELFTGPSIRRITSEGLYDLEKLQKEWRVFVIKNRPFKGELNLKTGSFVLHEYHNLESEKFHVLTVDENYVQMSSFIMKNLKIESFENGRAFYEFTDEEDLIYYKEVVNGLRKKVDGSDTLCVQPDVSLFYSLPEAPGLGIQPPKLAHARVFVQSTAYGSRCLKAGTTVLYKIGNEQEHLECSTEL